MAPLRRGIYGANPGSTWAIRAGVDRLLGGAAGPDRADDVLEIADEGAYRKKAVPPDQHPWGRSLTSHIIKPLEQVMYP
jgi:hypothetical protein